MSRDSERMWKIAGRYSAVGIEIAAAVGIGTIGGWYLDRELGTKWIFWVGLVVGTGAAVRTIIRLIKTTKL